MENYRIFTQLLTQEQKEELTRWMSRFFGYENVRREDIWTYVRVSVKSLNSAREQLDITRQSPAIEVINKVVDVFACTERLKGNELPSQDFCIQFLGSH